MCTITKTEFDCHIVQMTEYCQRRRREGYLPENCDTYRVVKVLGSGLCPECKAKEEEKKGEKPEIC